MSRRVRPVQPGTGRDPLTSLISMNITRIQNGQFGRFCTDIYFKNSCLQPRNTFKTTDCFAFLTTGTIGHGVPPGLSVNY